MMGTEKAQQQQTTLVLGGTGKIGRRVAQRLKARGNPTRVGSRSGEPPFDWGDELAGPRLLTFAEAIGEIAGATGRKILYVPVSVKEYASMLSEQGVPAEFVGMLTYLFSEVLDGRNAYLTDGVRRALGREPKVFGAYARYAAATGIWGVGR
jgi:uncharacterized protein YbjT (DUF2867 family)